MEGTIGWDEDEREILKEMNLLFDPDGPLTDDQLNHLHEHAPDCLEFVGRGDGLYPARRGWAAGRRIDKLADVTRLRGMVQVRQSSNGKDPPGLSLRPCNPASNGAEGSPAPRPAAREKLEGSHFCTEFFR